MQVKLKTWTNPNNQEFHFSDAKTCKENRGSCSLLRAEFVKSWVPT